MKRKSIYLFAALATAAFSLSSCSNDESTESVNSPAELKITAEIYPSIDVTTRALYNLQNTTLQDYTNIGIYVWYAGKTAAKTDAPTYTGYANNKVATATPDGTSGNFPYTLTPTTTPMYFPIDNSNVDVYLYAPYKASPTQAGMCMEHTVSTNQCLTAGYTDSDFIYGKATAVYSGDKTARVKMYHAMSKIIFKVVDNGVSATNMSNITLKNAYTKTTINMPQAISSSVPYLSCGNNTTDNVGVATDLNDIIVWNTTAGTGAVSTPDTKTNGIAFVVPPQTTSSTSGSEAKVSITVDGKTATADFKNKTLAPGYVYTYNLKLTGQTLTITLVSIEDWISGGSGNLDFTNWS